MVSRAMYYTAPLATPLVLKDARAKPCTAPPTANWGPYLPKSICGPWTAPFTLSTKEREVKSPFTSVKLLAYPCTPEPHEDWNDGIKVAGEVGGVGRVEHGTPGWGDGGDWVREEGGFGGSSGYQILNPFPDLIQWHESMWTHTSYLDAQVQVDPTHHGGLSRGDLPLPQDAVIAILMLLHQQGEFGLPNDNRFGSQTSSKCFVASWCSPHADKQSQRTETFSPQFTFLLTLLEGKCLFMRGVGVGVTLFLAL